MALTYKIVSCETVEELEKDVRAAQANGWVVIGNLVVQLPSTPLEPPSPIYHQTMVKV